MNPICHGPAISNGDQANVEQPFAPNRVFAASFSISREVNA